MEILLITPLFLQLPFEAAAPHTYLGCSLRQLGIHANNYTYGSPLRTIAKFIMPSLVKSHEAQQ